jgi:outer membrane protein assembly factor BamB
MSEHLNRHQLISYVYRALHDPELETVEHHLNACSECRARLAEQEAVQRRIHRGVLTLQRQVIPPARMTYTTISLHLKRSRRFMMVIKQSNQFVYGALTMALLIAVGVGLYFFVSNLSRPTPMTPEEVEQPLPVPTIVSQPEVKPTTEISQPAIDLASTGAMFRGGPQRTGVFDTPGPEQGELMWKFEALGAIFSPPAIADGIVYFGSQGNKFYAVDATTGQEKWQFQTGGGVKSSSAIAAGLVYFGSDDKHLYALDAQTGQEKWRFKTEAFVASSPLVSGGMVYFGSTDTYIYALDAQTGQEKWRFKTEDSVWSSPALADGVLYFGSGCDCLSMKGKNFYALDSQTGQELWRFETGDRVESSPAVADGVVYFGSHDDYLYALDSQTGQERWKFKTGDAVTASPAVADGLVYVGSRDGHLYALDAQTGQEQWKFKAANWVESPVVANGVVYFAENRAYAVDDSKGYVYALDSRTGQELWKFQTGGGSYSSPFIAEGVLYWGSSDNFLYALQ